MNNNTNNKGIGRKLRMQKKDKMDRVELKYTPPENRSIEI
jgi:hypothetical protein